MGSRSRRTLQVPAIESLERRAMLTATLTAVLPAVTLTAGAAASTVNISNDFAAVDVPADTVFFDTTLGTIPVQLTPGVAPATVANFLSYVTVGSYDGSIIHRSYSDQGLSVIQGGGYTPTVAANGVVNAIDPIPTQPTIQDEYSPSHPNARGTLAMANRGKPDSADDQWYFNVSDNSTYLAPNNEYPGYTTFGSVIGNGLAVMDRIASLPVYDETALLDGDGALQTLPLTGYTAGEAVTANNLVTVTAIRQASAYVAASDDPAVVTASVTDGVLTYTPVAPGTAGVTVTATGLDGQSVSQAFTVTVGNAKGSVPKVAPSTTPVGTTTAVTVGAGGARSLHFTDADGGSATVTLRGPGSAIVNLVGDGLKVTRAAATVVTGPLDGIGTLSVIGGTPLTRLTIASNGRHEIPLATLNAGGLGTLAAPGVTLTGAATFSGTVNALSLAATAATSSITLARPASSIHIRASLAGTLSGTSIDSISAATLDAATLSASGPVASVAVRTMTHSTLTSAGDLGRITIAGAATGSTIYAGATSATVDAATVAAGTGRIAALRIGSTFSDTAVAAAAIVSARIGQLSDAAGTARFAGIAAGQIGRLHATLGRRPFTVRHATTADALAAQLTAAHVAPMSVVLEIV